MIPTLLQPVTLEEMIMANCSEMKTGDVYACQLCGLELEVVKTCSCEPGGEGGCTVPLQCCGQEMTKK